MKGIKYKNELNIVNIKSVDSKACSRNTAQAFCQTCLFLYLYMNMRFSLVIFILPVLLSPPSCSLFILLSFSFFLSTFIWSRGRKQWSIIVCRERGLGNVILHFPHTETSNTSFSLPSGQNIFIFPSSWNYTDAAKTARNEVLEKKNPSYIFY